MMPREPRADETDLGSPTSVYRYYDRHDLLIYVGITARGVTRNREHNSRAAWWPYVVRQEVEHYDTRTLAEEREKALILEFRPPFNTQHNPDSHLTRAAYLAWVDADERANDPLKVWGEIKRRLPISVISRDAGRLTLITRPEHYPVASRLCLPEQRRVFISGQMGVVRAVEMRNLFAVIHVKAKAEFVPDASGIAHLRMASQKPVRFEVNSLSMGGRR